MLDDAFALHFEGPLPDVVNAEQQFTIVASELDATSDRIVEFLAEDYGVPINAVFFWHFSDDGRESWPAPCSWTHEMPRRKSLARLGPKVRPWNGRDFYVVLGRVGQGGERWQLASRYGLLSAGGGSWYWKPLSNLTPGKRVFAYVGGAGYVGVGHVTSEMIPARDGLQASGRGRGMLARRRDLRFSRPRVVAVRRRAACCALTGVWRAGPCC